MSIASPFTTTDLAVAIRANVLGDVVTPDEPSFPAATFGFTRTTGEGPELVVIAARAADVAAAVRAAARAGRRVSVQTPAGTTGDGTVLIVTRLLAGVRIDPGSRTATVGVAAGWRQVLDAAEPHGLFAPGAGTAEATVPASTQAGFGFSADHITALQFVTATGDLTWVHRHSDPLLFSRIRRGVGTVTAMVVDLVPLPSLYAGAMWLAVDTDPVALQHYHAWAALLPANTSTSLSRHQLPDDAGVPAGLRGREALRVGFAHLGTPADGARLIAPLRAAAPWLLDSVTEMPWSAVGVGLRTPRAVRSPVGIG
ncbi:FAD-binding protein [Nakamurella sp. GG22]